MEHVTCVALLCCCLLITIGTDGQPAGNVEIENCSGNVIDIREKKNNTILCKEFNAWDIILWTFKRNDEEIPKEVAKCYQLSCTVLKPDHFAVERSRTQSQLFYQQYDRGVDKGATVTCESRYAKPKRSTSCAVNVINPAELSRCAVEEDRVSGTLTGSCRFEHAYSFRRPFTCTWYQGKVGQPSSPIPGDITYDNGSDGSSGRCTFTSTVTNWDVGTYTYSINFYPGTGKITVNVGQPNEQAAGDVEIENCTDNFIDILEQANNAIVCEGFNPEDTILWTFKRNGEEIPVATCMPSHCAVHQPDHFAVERSPSNSTLLYQQYDREVDKLAKVTCESHFGESTRSRSCTLNVINPAKLSSCAVEKDTAKGTVTGKCRFEHAFSFSRYFKCTWYQEKVGQSSPLPGNIEYDSSYQSPNGWCTFTSTDTARQPGTYTYSILFYPGPGKLTVNIDNLDTNRPISTCDTTPTKRSPDVSLPTTKDGVHYTSPRTQEENDLPLGAIVGGIVAVVVIIVVVVVVVVFVRRKKKQKPAGSAHGSSNDNATDNDDFEEHVNPMYGTSDGQDDTLSTDHKPSATALRISPNSHNGHPAAPHSLDSDIYTTVDSEARFVPSNQTSGMGDRPGGYEDIGFDSDGNTRVPQKDEYAVVDKSRAKKGPASSANTSASSPTHTTEGSDEYAVVDKSSSRNKAAKNVASSLPDDTANNAGADVYAQVNKSTKKVKVADPKTEGAAYAQVQKPKPAIKPKTSAKPPSNKDVTESSAADDDEYHTLSHTRGSPETQEQADLESQYSHIGHD